MKGLPFLELINILLPTHIAEMLSMIQERLHTLRKNTDYNIYNVLILVCYVKKSKVLVWLIDFNVCFYTVTLV